ncbi:MAG TPA: carboxylating nicotinate-nucleotide diphosphorylase [Planctomycetota bacterium]|nr:carboxylating nicotinate-nucleotide diphosphorylase [Planctomycetota bacterium]
MSPPHPSRSDGPPSSDQDVGLVPDPPHEVIEAVVVAALDEDGMPPEACAGLRGARSLAPRRTDLTSDSIVPEHALARGRLVAKGSGVLCGVSVFSRALEVCDPAVEIELLARDGERLAPGQEVLRAVGKARGLLYAERTALNFIQRLSGVATATARYVELCAGRAKVLDTRKTTPNLRALEKYAVRCGGGTNHRFGLFDQAMVKNNHADLAGVGLLDLLRGLRTKLGPAITITSEARDLAEARAGIDGDADVVLLDNFRPEELPAVVRTLREHARGRTRPLELEASGGISERNVALVAESGVDRISIGALTHSATALDFSFYLRPA